MSAKKDVPHHRKLERGTTKMNVLRLILRVLKVTLIMNARLDSELMQFEISNQIVNDLDSKHIFFDR